jgi:hypothetical protein
MKTFHSKTAICLNKLHYAFVSSARPRTAGHAVAPAADTAAVDAPPQLGSLLELTVNEEKTCSEPEGGFDFLGFTFERMYSATTGQARRGLRVSKKRIRRMVEKIHALTAVKTAWQDREMG